MEKNDEKMCFGRKKCGMFYIINRFAICGREIMNEKSQILMKI
jgi:hypothetical protein